MSEETKFDKKRWRGLQALSAAVAAIATQGPRRASSAVRGRSRDRTAKPRRERAAQALKDCAVPYPFRSAKSTRRYGLLEKVVVHPPVRLR